MAIINITNHKCVNFLKFDRSFELNVQLEANFHCMPVFGWQNR